jgi:predicted DNA-binding transcriptional regulator AlpA
MSLEPPRVHLADAPTLDQTLARMSDRPEAGDPLLIDAKALARLLAVSEATLARMKSAAKLPRPVELSRGCHRYRLAEIRAWVEAGCPARREWEARQVARSRA